MNMYGHDGNNGHVTYDDMPNAEMAETQPDRQRHREHRSACMCWTVVWSWCRWGWGESCISPVPVWREAI